MSIDEALLEARLAGEMDDTIRFYQFSPSAVSIGYFQSMRSQVHDGACIKNRINIVRRMTGGGAVYHDNQGEITYSIVMKISPKIREIVHSYEQICGGIVEGLGIIGINARFSPINDVLVGDKKISGSAQTRRNGILLQHGTLMYGTDIKMLANVLNVSKEKLSDKYVQSVSKRVTTVKIEKGHVSFEELLSALKEGFAKIFGPMHDITFPPTVLERAHELEHCKYDTESFLFLR
ncbi:MAG: lipoate--protein ligase family protein [Candidatus Methanofastidiosia archaeon]